MSFSIWRSSSLPKIRKSSLGAGDYEVYIKDSIVYVGSKSQCSLYVKNRLESQRVQ